MPNTAEYIDSIHGEIKRFIERYDSKAAGLQRQLDELHARAGDPGQRSTGGASPVEELVRKMVDGRGDFERFKHLSFEIASPTLAAKTFTSANLIVSTAGSEIGTYGRAPYGRVRAALPSEPVDTGSVFQITETASSFVASPQTEASDKLESSATLSGTAIGVKTIASWAAATKQSLDDIVGLRRFIETSLLWSLAREIEEQVLLGDNTGENLNGLNTQAVSFDTTILSASAGWTLWDILGAAGVQVAENGFGPSHAVVSPRDYWRMRSARGSDGQYIGNPELGMEVIPSNAMPSGSFLVGDFSKATLRVRQSATIDLSESHSDFFVKNKIAIRAEERAALVVTSPRAFVTGSITRSPA
jgi:HK97 family phage major capsid protein